MRKKINIFIASAIFSFILWGSISLSDEYYTTFDVSLSVIDIPEGYTTGSRLPDKVSLKIRGQGWKLVSSKIGADTDYKISVNADSGRKFISLYNNLTSNQRIISELEVIDIVPDTISIFVERIVSKKLPVKPLLNLDFKPGYGLAKEIFQSPDSIVVFGPLSFMKNLTEIKTVRTSLSELNKKTEKVVVMPQLPGVSYRTSSVNLTIDVQKIVDKEFDEIAVEIFDVPLDKDVLLIPNKISCSVRGGIEVLGKLSSNNFKAFVYYNDIVRDTLGNIIPNIEIPENVTPQFLKPERLRYIIKSY
jgi:YbbR domain-containing protein